ncbi:MAG TPA: lamin tail domain-containing protein, partial [Verrucomicrobiae bacterium]|nr:lamin tail domain-containing protein [Verrucomicrobiae bacterium]
MMLRKFPGTLGLALVLIFSLNTHAQVRISEFMASNTHTLADEDGAFEDWIEVQNTSTATVNLLDWSLTDSANNLAKWRFPATNLPPGGFIVVFASSEDRRVPGKPLHTNFKLDADGEFLALVNPAGTVIATQFSPTYPPQVSDVSFGFALTSSNVTLIATNASARALIPSIANGGSDLNYHWIGNNDDEPFNEASWVSGFSGIGFGAGSPGEIGLNVQSPMRDHNASAFIRIPFQVSNPTNFSLLDLRLKYDDGFVAWINGVRVAQANAPAEDFNWDSAAVNSHPASEFEDIILENVNALLRPGANVLAIQGLNSAASDSTFLILPELTGVTVAGDTAGLYFTAPTPGDENLGGATVPGPGITEVAHTPAIPLDNDNIVVTANVFRTAAAIANVTMRYRVMFGPEVVVPMADDGAHDDGAAGDGIFGATIPASASNNGYMVRYFITATDINNASSRLPIFNDPTSTAQYFGTVINPNYVTSALPVVHLFAPPTVLQPGPHTSQNAADSDSGSRVSLYFDGEFYDNIHMQLRGNSTAGYDKKSHRLEFNREHKFRYSDSAKRIRKTSFMADYPDPAYMRQRLCFWLAEQMGLPAPFAMPMRLQLNGVFYQLATHSDVEGEEMLERLGFDPNGAFYANVGTVVPSLYSTGGFEKKTRKAEGNDDFVALANAISENLPLGKRATNLFDILDVPEVINYMAVARFTHQNDDVWANMAVYHDNDGDDLWRIMPYDQNLSFGAAYMNGDAYSGIQSTNDNLKSHPLYGSSQTIPSGSGNWNRLYDVIFQVPETREMFLRRLRTLMDEFVKPPGTVLADLPIEQKALEWRNLIAPETQLDRAWWGWPGKGGQCNFDPGINLTNGVDQIINQFMASRRAHLYRKHSVTNIALPIGINKTSNAGIPLAQPANAAIAISALDYNPASGNQDEEYVRLSNTNEFAIDVSDWELSGGIQFKFKGGTVIPANNSLYVSPNVKAFRNRAISPHGGQALFAVGPYSGRLSARGETLTLANAAGDLISSNSFAGNPSLTQQYLRITEVMYNPSPAPAISDDAQQFEFVELKNISPTVTLNLAGVRFAAGIDFNFTGSAVTSLAPGQTVLVVRNQSAFIGLYGSGFNIAGQYSGALNSGGETLRLEDAVGEKILEFTYNNTWYPITDGLGFSLVIVDENAPWNSWDNAASWRASGRLNGSPGEADSNPPTIAPIVINEILTHTDLPQLDSVELLNPTSSAASIGGWYLTDDFLSPKKYRIPDGTTIPAGGYLVITENEFNVGPNAFRFSELGESVYLLSADASSNLTGYVTGYDFPAEPNGVSFGRYTNSAGVVDLVLQSTVTLGSANAYPRVGPIVISEIMYHPPETNGADDSLAEFIELQNITGNKVRLYDVEATTNTWRLRDAVSFDFPTNQSLAAGARLLVVGFDPANAAQLAAFRDRFNVPSSVAVYGPWIGRLDNSGETLVLDQPGPVDDTSIVPFYRIDKVSYADAAPWPAGADGIGNSLQRISNSAYGNEPTNWFAAGVTAGRANVFNLAPNVSILSPADGATITSTNGFTVSVSANDPGGAVALVQLFGDGVELARWSATSSNYVWSSASSGIHQLQVRVTDNLGGITESPSVSVTLLLPPPTVNFLNPADNAILPAGSSVLLSASASSGGGSAARVNYFLDGALIGSAGFPFSLPWTPSEPGYHQLSAIAYDAQDQASEAVERSIFVQAVVKNPIVISAGSEWRYLD